MTRIFNAYQSLRTWVVTHTEYIYAAVIAPFFGYFAPIKNIFLLALAVSILKLIVGVATIAYIEQFIVLGIIGIIAILFFTWEQLKEYKKLEKESKEAMDARIREKNRNK